MTSIDAAHVNDLQQAVAGEVCLPGTPGYDTTCSLWNGAITRRPALVVRCAEVADVVAGLAFARRQGLEVSVRGGGHGYAGFALTDGGLTLDLGSLCGVTIAPLDKRAVVGGGATWEQFDAAAQEYGLAAPGGFISHTGVGGLTLGGGLGWLTRKAGLSCDNLLEAQVVTADGRVLRAADDENPDLFWAIRGGGGNFGVVTSFTFSLVPVGPMVNLAMLFVDLAHGVQLMRFARDLNHGLPDGVASFIGSLNAPPEPFVPEAVQFQPGYALLLVGFDDAEVHAALVAKAQAALPTLFELVTPMPYVALQQMFDGSAPWGIQAYEKAVYLEELTDAAIDVIACNMPKKSSPLSLMPLFCLGGAYGRVAEDAVAFGGSRRIRYVVNLDAASPDPSVFAEDRAWVRAFWDELLPHAAGAGGYVNFMAEYDADRVRAAYGPEKYARLQQIKAEYDPENVFHLNANIQPAMVVSRPG